MAEAVVCSTQPRRPATPALRRGVTCAFRYTFRKAYWTPFRYTFSVCDGTVASGVTRAARHEESNERRSLRSGDAGCNGPFRYTFPLLFSRSVTEIFRYTSREGDGNVATCVPDAVRCARATRLLRYSYTFCYTFLAKSVTEIFRYTSESVTETFRYTFESATDAVRRVCNGIIRYVPVWGCNGDFPLHFSVTLFEKCNGKFSVTLFYGSSTLVLRDYVECLCVAHTLAVMWNGCPDQPQGAS